MAAVGMQTEKAARLAAAVFEHGSIRDGALAIGVPERTARRLAATEEFAAALSAARSAAMQDVAARLQSAGREAVDTLLEIMRNVENPPGVRCRCAGLILENLVKQTEFASLTARVDNIEKGQPVEIHVVYDTPPKVNSCLT